jgi:hypothetical protein
VIAALRAQAHEDLPALLHHAPRRARSRRRGRGRP